MKYISLVWNVRYLTLMWLTFQFISVIPHYFILHVNVFYEHEQCSIIHGLYGTETQELNLVRPNCVIGRCLSMASRIISLCGELLTQVLGREMRSPQNVFPQKTLRRCKSHHKPNASIITKGLCLNGVYSRARSWRKIRSRFSNARKQTPVVPLNHAFPVENKRFV